MKLLRVFPRKTNATPIDDDARFDVPGLFDEADKVEVSVTFTNDKGRGEHLAEAWRTVTKNVSIGGPAYDDRGGEFEPGKYLKHGYVFTSRGCPNRCWFCYTPKREGEIRELEIKDGYNILDSNLLACSDGHIKRVFEMLKRQKEKPRFTGGLDPALMRPWIAESLKDLKPMTAYFAYDDPHDYEHLMDAVKILRDYNILPDKSHSYFCYVLIGYRGDTFDMAQQRLHGVIDLGLIPMAMLYNRGDDQDDKKTWKKFQREYANKTIVSAKLLVRR